MNSDSRPKCFSILFIMALILSLSILSIGCGGGGGGDNDNGDATTNPTVTINNPMYGNIFTEGDTITFSGSGDDAEDGTLTGYSLVWTSSIDGEIGTGASFSITNLSVGAHTITLTATDSDGDSDVDSIEIIVALFYDDFENADCLNKWTVGGRQQEGTNIADCEIRNESTMGHLFKYSFTEINFTPAVGAFEFSENLNFEFDMEVRVSSSGSAPSNYYGKSGAEFRFYDSEDNLLGIVSYIAATTQYPFDHDAADPTRASIELTQNNITKLSLSVEDILSNIVIDETQIAVVGMTFNTYSSTRPIPYVEAELWIDNVIVSDWVQ